MTWLPNGDFQYIPAKFDPARMLPDDDRSDTGLSRLVREMDELTAEWKRVQSTQDPKILHVMTSEMVIKWEAIREAMR